jgi:hypothetical protein
MDAMSSYEINLRRPEHVIIDFPGQYGIYVGLFPSLMYMVGHIKWTLSDFHVQA